jgi:nitroimidazol reductase NimA-like FMN-containing flavoprotein (pyridoxamine 5'-phosphate oxidase superfamily)
MTTSAAYRIASLTREEAAAVLARNDAGRVAFTFRDRVDVEPVSHVHAGGVIDLRTAAGTKLETLMHRASVAFEVDEIGGSSDLGWQPTSRTASACRN